MYLLLRLNIEAGLTPNLPNLWRNVQNADLDHNNMTLDFFGGRYPLLLDTFKPLFNPTNRDMKRRMAQEYETIFPKIWDVEKSFYAHVLGDNEYDYKTIAHFHHKWMASVIEHTKRVHKPRFWAINEDRFKTIIN